MAHSRTHLLRALPVTALLGLSALGVAACSKHEDQPAAAHFSVKGDQIHFTPTPSSPVRFTSAQAVAAPPLASPPVTARVLTIDSLTSPSYAPLSGHVVEVAVKLGDPVKKGDRLALVRTADLATLNHDLRATRLAVKTKESIVERTDQLVQARAASENDLVVAKSELEELRFAERAAAAKLGSLSVSPTGDNTFWIVASREGVVVTLDASSGKQVGPSDERPVATVADLNEVWVVGDVPEKDAATLEVGMEAAIFSPGRAERLQTGKVEIVADVVDPDRQTVPIRVRADNRARHLRPNAFVNLVFTPTSRKDVVQVPTGAVVSDGAEAVVFVRSGSGLFSRRPVELGVQTRDKAEILSGLQPGEEVVVSGALLLLNALQLDD